MRPFFIIEIRIVLHGNSEFSLRAKIGTVKLFGFHTFEE